jgi:cytochrome c oxidase assembly protein subunit 11
LVSAFNAGGVALSSNEIRDAENRKLIFRILLGLVASIAFAVSMVPLYNVLCEITGFNGKTSGSATEISKTLKVDESRWIKVEFTSSVMPGLPWQFSPVQSSVKVRPGRMETVTYVAKNITSQASVGQAIPSVSPGKAAQHFNKIECFCFQRQELQPGESKEMPLTFYVSPDLPEDIRTITLSYAFFSAVKQVAN